MSEFSLAVLSAILPGILLLCFIDRKDSLQHEPFKEILKAFAMGMSAALCAGVINTLEVLTGVMNEEPTTLLGSMWISFFGAGLNEEGLKLFALWLFLRKNKYFDEHMDGIVYAAAVGMGFATLENIDYVFEAGIEWRGCALSRGLFSVPGHFIFAVAMGYFYSLWHFRKDKRYLRRAFFVPFVCHGIYDTLCFYEKLDWVGVVLLAGLLCVAFFIGSKLIRKHLQNDLFTDQRTPTAVADGQIEEAIVVDETGAEIVETEAETSPEADSE